VARLDDIEGGEPLYRLAYHRESHAHGLRKIALRGKAIPGLQLARRDALQDRNRDLVGQRLNGGAWPVIVHLYAEEG
jgi:hypothetical protein